MSEPNLVGNYVLTPAARTAGEEYATYEHLITPEDIAECAVCVPWWGNVWIRVRGLSLLDEAAIERAGRISAARYRQAHPYDTGAPESDWEAEFAEVLVLGFVTPRLTQDRARQLLAKNARGIDELVRLIRMLNRMSYDAIRGTAEARIDARTPDTSANEL